METSMLIPMLERLGWTSLQTVQRAAQQVHQRHQQVLPLD